MNNEYTVSFFGHMDMDTGILKRKLYHIIKDLSTHNKDLIFVMGRNGDVAHAVYYSAELLRKNDKTLNIRIKLLLANMEEYYNKFIDMQTDHFDETEVCRESMESYPQISEYIRDCHMIGNSDTVIFFLKDESEALKNAYDHAVKKNRSIIVITDDEPEE